MDYFHLVWIENVESKCSSCGRSAANAKKIGDSMFRACKCGWIITIKPKK